MTMFRSLFNALAEYLQQWRAGRKAEARMNALLRGCGFAEDASWRGEKPV